MVINVITIMVIFSYFVYDYYKQLVVIHRYTTIKIGCNLLV